MLACYIRKHGECEQWRRGAGKIVEQAGSICNRKQSSIGTVGEE
jgi:hypothetical protein